MAKKIVDVSKYQSIDWKTASQDLALAIIRVQYGSRLEDSKHKEHEAGAKKYGVPFWNYAYGHFVSVADAIVEANDFIKRSDPEAVGLALDTESDTVESCGTALVAEASQAFLDVLKKAGFKTGYYVSHNLYKKYGLDKVKSDFLWIPRYGVNDGTFNKKPDFACDLHQFTSTGSVKGIAGNVDLNRLNGDKNLEWFTGKKSSSETETTPEHNKDYLELGDRGTSVKTMQRLLCKANFYPNKDAQNQGVDGIFGKNTEDALIRFQKYYLPKEVDGKYGPHTKAKLEEVTKKAPTPNHVVTEYKTITVERGDSLSAIAAKYGTITGVLEKLNNISNPDLIRIGQHIRVPISGHAAPRKDVHKYVTVHPNDNLTKIAKENNLTLNDILKLNPSIKDPDMIQIGQHIRVK